MPQPQESEETKKQKETDRGPQKGKRPPRKPKQKWTQITYGQFRHEFSKVPAESTFKVGPGDVKGTIFARADGGFNILADLLNDKISLTEASQRLFDLGVRSKDDQGNDVPYTKQNLMYYKKKVIENAGYNLDNYKDVFFVPFATKGMAASYLKKAQTELQQYDPDHPSHKNFKIDPVVGLNLLVMELDAYTESVSMGFKQYLQAVHLKAKLYEKIDKIDDSNQSKVNQNKLVKKLHALAEFAVDIQEQLQQQFDKLSQSLLKLFGNDISDISEIEQLLTTFKQQLNIKEQYLDYIADMEGDEKKEKVTYDTSEIENDYDDLQYEVSDIEA